MYLVTQPGAEELLRESPSDDAPLLDAQDPFEQAHIRAGLPEIPIRERIVIELTFWDGMSHREIALPCHFPLGTVKTRLHREKQRLKLLLQESV